VGSILYIHKTGFVVSSKNKIHCGKIQVIT
jgi:hypothetical protein